MPDLTIDQLTVALATVAGVALLSIVTTLLLALRLKRMHSRLAVIRGENQDVDVLSALGRTTKQVDGLDRRIDSVVVALEEQADLRRMSIQKFGLVRYDAFEEMGGRLSFSAALLDDHGDGVVITSINGRTETRTYAKPVASLESTHNLSEEERKAISMAASRRTGAQVPAAR